MLGNTARGQFSADESQQHVNVLDLKASLFGLKALCSVSSTHIQVQIDNAVAVGSLNKMGITKSANMNLEVHVMWISS